MTHILAHQFIDGFNGNHQYPAEQRVWFEILGSVEAVSFEIWLRRIVQQSCGFVAARAVLWDEEMELVRRTGEMHAGIRQTRILFF